MVHRFQVSNPYSMPIPPVKKKTIPKQVQTDFGQVLQEANSLKVSKHAKTRMSERNISIDNTMWEAISEKVNDARKKGVTDSIVLIPDAALVVSTTNNTVIT